MSICCNREMVEGIFIFLIKSIELTYSENECENLLNKLWTLFFLHSIKMELYIHFINISGTYIVKHEPYL